MGAKTLPDNEEQQVNKKSEKNNAEESTSKKRKKREIIRIFPIWLRVIVIILLAIGALAAGLMFGYGVIGDGTATDIFKSETWKHITDIVTKEQ